MIRMSPIQVNKLKTLSGHKDALYNLQRLDENRFLSTGGDGMVVLWDLQNPDTGQMIVKVPASIYAMNYNMDRKLLVIGQNYSGIHLIDVASKKELKSVKLTNQAIFDIQTTNDAIFVATGEGEVIKLDWEFNILSRVKVSEKSIRTMALYSNRGELAIGSSDHHVYILDQESMLIKSSFEAHSNSVFTMSYHPDLPVLITAGRDARLKFWDIDNSYAIVEEIVAHMYTINHLTFSTDKQHFVTCSMDKSIKIWDANTFKLLKVIDKARHAGHGTSVNKLLWHDHKETLVSCSDDRTISLWDINFMA
jgi:WD40 repeat protein